MRRTRSSVLPWLAAAIAMLAWPAAARGAEWPLPLERLEIRREPGGIVIARPITPGATLALRIGPRPPGQNPGPRVMILITAPFKCRVPEER